MGKSAGTSFSRCFRAGRRGSPCRTCDQWSPHADLGLGPSRRSWTESLWQGPLAGNNGNAGAEIFAGSRTASSGNFATAASKSLVEYARERLSRELAAAGAPPEAVEAAKHLFDPNTLTLGFARRFATYKRPNLLLHDPQRLLRLLTDPKRPVQLIIAGKAHPADRAGQALIQEWMQFIRQPEVAPTCDLSQ